MGLFSRKDSSSTRKPPAKVRPSVSSEAQAAELRVRARRRLAGAVALVLAAIVVLPMLLDSEPIPVSSNVAIRIPDRNAPFQPNLSDQNKTDQSASGQLETPAKSTEQTSLSTSSPAASVPDSITAPSVSAFSAPVPAPKPEPKPEVKPKPEPKPEPKPAVVQRSDDGARALALLEGRPTSSASATPAKQPTKGNFVVQAVSLDSASDAQVQRDKLTAAGISNSFVDGPVVVNGQRKYRVRVGPFPSRESAQAAQTRLRTLGFGGAFITTQ